MYIVESNPNLTHNEIPNIVQGLDYIFMNGDHAVTATYWADEKCIRILTLVAFINF